MTTPPPTPTTALDEAIQKLRNASNHNLREIHLAIADALESLQPAPPDSGEAPSPLPTPAWGRGRHLQCVGQDIATRTATDADLAAVLAALPVERLRKIQAAAVGLMGGDEAVYLDNTEAFIRISNERALLRVERAELQERAESAEARERELGRRLTGLNDERDERIAELEAELSAAKGRVAELIAKAKTAERGGYFSDECINLVRTIAAIAPHPSQPSTPRPATSAVTSADGAQPTGESESRPGHHSPPETEGERGAGSARKVILDTSKAARSVDPVLVSRAVGADAQGPVREADERHLPKEEKPQGLAGDEEGAREMWEHAAREHAEAMMGWTPKPRNDLLLCLYRFAHSRGVAKGMAEGAERVREARKLAKDLWNWLADGHDKRSGAVMIEIARSLEAMLSEES